MTTNYEHAITLIDAANSEDPRQDVDANGTAVPRELLYGQRMAEMIGRYAPDADEAQKLSVRAQHI